MRHSIAPEPPYSRSCQHNPGTATNYVRRGAALEYLSRNVGLVLVLLRRQIADQRQ